LSADSLVAGALAGDRRALGRLLSLVEDGGPEVGPVMRALYPHTGRAYSLGITGAPGAGKSTLTERLVGRIRADGHSVGVLAVDPSSPLSGGALLGDRVRMQSHATDPEVFIRSMATRGHLGGMALATPEAMRVLDAAGKDYIVVETVGVGQAEVKVTDACDTTVVVLNPGWGDAVQVAKAGLLEVADVFVINKADRNGVRAAERELAQMLGLSAVERKPEIIPTIATTGDGVDELWAAIGRRRAAQSTEDVARARRLRIAAEIRDIAIERYRVRIEERCAGVVDRLVDQVEARDLDPYEAAAQLLRATESADRGRQ
jgi:LAO/AO transport system kinase